MTSCRSYHPGCDRRNRGLQYVCVRVGGVLSMHKAEAAGTLEFYVNSSSRGRR
jgi:hypothetical protein